MLMKNRVFAITAAALGAAWMLAPAISGAQPAFTAVAATAQDTTEGNAANAMPMTRATGNENARIILIGRGGGQGGGSMGDGGDGGNEAIPLRRYDNYYPGPDPHPIKRQRPRQEGNDRCCHRHVVKISQRINGRLVTGKAYGKWHCHVKSRRYKHCTAAYQKTLGH